MRHADDVDMRPASGRLYETEQSDVIGQRQIVELRVDHDVRNVQLFVGQLLGRHANIVFAKPHLQHRADVATRQTVEF
jgi:hypothetical protein